MQTKKKVLLIGLDGASWGPIERWARRGRLPTFRRLLDEGAWGDLESTILPISFPAWCSMFTGKNPGKHGVFDFLDKKTGTYSFYVNSSRNVRAKFLWEKISEEGRKCGIINIPCSSPLGQSVLFGEGDFLRKDMRDVHWDVADVILDVSPSSPRYISRLKEIVQNRFNQLKSIINEREWDFVATNIYVIDHMLHFRMHDPEDILEVFRLVDKCLAEILDSIDKSTILLLVSDHGMRRVREFFFTNNWLQTRGFLTLYESVKNGPQLLLQAIGLTKTRLSHFINRLLTFTDSRTIRKLMSKRNLRDLYTRVRKRLPQGESMDFEMILKKGYVDWQHTTAFSFGDYGRIYLNVFKREPFGTVREDYYDRTRMKIARGLREYFQSQGHQIEIFPREKVYEGPCVGLAPDLMFIIDGGKVSPRMSFNLQGLIMKCPTPNEEKTGDHSREGIFLAFGCGVKPGFKVKDARIYDIFPTILHIMGIPSPSNIDGRVLVEIFENER